MAETSDLTTPATPPSDVLDYGVRAAQHWLPLTEGRIPPAGVTHMQDWLAGVCLALDGDDDGILELIEELPFQ
jgi:hypothetical protein